MQCDRPRLTAGPSAFRVLSSLRDRCVCRGICRRRAGGSPAIGREARTGSGHWRSWCSWSNCPPATAAVVSTDPIGASLVLTAGVSSGDKPDLAREITAAQVAGGLDLASAGEAITIAPATTGRCRYTAPPQQTAVTCDLTGLQRVAVLTGVGADTITVIGGLTTIICGGPGDDHITGGAGGDFISGAAGDDTLAGGTGNDVLRGDRQSSQREVQHGVG